MVARSSAELPDAAAPRALACVRGAMLIMREANDRVFGVALAPRCRSGRCALRAGESADAARAMGYSVNLIRLRATNNVVLTGITTDVCVHTTRWKPIPVFWLLASRQRQRRIAKRR